MWSGRHDDYDGSEDGEISDIPDIRATTEEIRLAAEVVVYLEHELGIDVKRIRVRVREGVFYVQGTVTSHEEKRYIEKSLPKRPQVKASVINLSVVEE